MGSFLLGFKRQLVDWGFNKRDIQVDLENHPGTVQVGGPTVMSACIRAGSLVVSWSHPTWGAWSDLVSSLEYKTLVNKAEEKLRKGGNRGKGKGTKGKGNGKAK